MKLKNYPKDMSSFIKENVSLYTKEVSTGIYYIVKNTEGDYHYFLGSKELSELLNTVDHFALEQEKKILFYAEEIIFDDYEELFNRHLYKKYMQRKSDMFGL